MPIARFQLPDGRVARFEVPEGTTPEQAQQQIEAHLATVPPTQATKSQAETAPDEAEMLAGKPAVRFALGAAAPFLGAAQLGAEAVGATGVTEHLKRLEQMKKRGMTPAADLANLKQARDQLSKLKGYDAAIARIDEQIAALGEDPSASPEDAGFDLAGLAGTVMSPAVLGAMKIPAAGSILGRAGQGAALGAAFGAASPVTHGDNFWSTKAGQAATGAAIGGVIPPAIEGVRRVGGVVRNMLDPLLSGGAERGATRMLAEAAGPKRAGIEAELAKQQMLVPGSQPTGAEAAARAGSPEFSALQQIAREHRSSAYSDIAKTQEAARQASIQSFGKDKAAIKAAKKLRSEAAKEAYGAIRHLKVDPRSDVEIMQDAIGRARGAPFSIAGREDFTGKAGAAREWGKFATTKAENITRGENFYPVAGMPRVPARVSNFPERAEEAAVAARDALEIAKAKLREEKFLENTLDLLKQTVGMEEKNLQFFLSRPSVREAVKDAMQSAMETGSYFPTKAGDKFSVGNLQRIKESLDAGILAAQNAARAGKRPELSQAELEGTKRAFVKWLSAKSPEWQAARHEYLLNSRPLNEMAVGQELEAALIKPIGEGERAGVFATAAREAPRTIKKATGQPRFEDLDEVLQPENLGKVKGVLADLARKAEFERLVPLGRSKAVQIAQPFGLPATGPLHQSYMIFKTVLGRVSKGINEKTLDTMADALELPSSTLKLLQRAPTEKQAQLIDQIISMKLGRGAIAAGASLSGEGVQQ